MRQLLRRLAVFTGLSSKGDEGEEGEKRPLLSTNTSLRIARMAAPEGESIAGTSLDTPLTLLSLTDDSNASSPPPPPRRTYASASQAKKASPPPPVPPKHASLQQHTPSAVQPSSFFAPNSSPSAPLPSADKNRRGSGSSRPAGSASKRNSNVWAKSVAEDDGIEIVEQPHAGVGRAPTSSVREVQPGEEVGAWQDDWVTSGKTWNEQVNSAHRPNSPSSAVVSPHFQHSASLQHLEHASPGYSTYAELPPIPSSSPAPPVPSNFFYHSPSQNDHRNGLWTVPRILALPGNAEGGFSGIWQYAMWDFPLDGTGPVRDTPAGEKSSGAAVYRPMGAWVDFEKEEEEKEAAARAEQGEEAVVEDTPMSGEDTALSPPVPTVDDDVIVEETQAVELAPDVPPKSPKSPKPFSTITREELSTRTRPHPHLYFCVETFSWVLVAPLPPTSSPTSVFGDSALATSDAPELWTGADDFIDPSLAEQYLTDNLNPPLGRPMEPADPSSFSMEAPPHSPWTPATADGAIKEFTGTKGNRAVVSSQSFYPGVIGKRLWLALLKKRAEEPPVGKTAEEARYHSVRFIWRCVPPLFPLTPSVEARYCSST
jgi:hypothetical protein